MAITLREITVDNWWQIADLSVKDEQKNLVASNLRSLAEAKYGFPGERADLKMVPLAIYDDEEPVGFLMYNVGPSEDRYYVMRLMIDQRYQGKGHGRTAMEELLQRFLANPHAKEVAISYVPDNQAAKQLYASLGFEEIGVDGGETLAWRTLNEQDEPWTSLWKR